ncbi:MAG: helix-turn-helix transcriptional regulator [Pseudomonadales bacterium]
MDNSISKSWFQVSAQAIEQLHTADFFLALDAAVNQLVPNLAAICIAFPPDSRPLLLEEHSRVELPESFTGSAYLAGAYLLDPYYLAALRGIEPGCYRLLNLIPEGAKGREFLAECLLPSGMADELGILFPLNNGTYLHWSITRNVAFSDEEFEMLEAIFPWLRALMQQQWDVDNRLLDIASTELELHKQVRRAFDNFGSSLLTQREAEIAQMVLAGYSSPLIAGKLEISAETVKVHRRHIYEKLDISSQSELFALFINSMTMIGAAGSDPLEAYYRVPG